MMSRRYSSVVNAAFAAFTIAAGALATFACGGPAAPAVDPAASASASAARAIPPCPTSILQGGDPLEAESFEGKRVARICFVGSESAVKAAAKAATIKEGDTFTADRVRVDLEAIQRTGFFDDVATYGLKGRDAMVLVFAVTERPRVAEITVVGAKALGDGLAQKLPIEKNEPYVPAKVNVYAQAIRDEYRTRGYDSCQVKLVTEPAGAGLVKVRIAVTEGPRILLGKIDLKGNAKVKEADLRKASQLTSGNVFIQDEIERATIAMSSVYYDRGMVASRIRPEVSLDGAKGVVAVVFEIEEGDVFTVGTLKAGELAAPFEKELLEKVVKVRPKQTFSRAALIEDIERIRKFFAAKNKDVVVTPATNIDEKKKTVDLSFDVIPGSLGPPGPQQGPAGPPKP